MNYGRMLTKLVLLLLMTLPNSVAGKSYVVGDLMGQLGNQMFIIAATSSLAWDHGAKPLFPDLANPPDARYNIPENHKKIFFRLDASKPKKKIKHSYIEPHYHYAPIPHHKRMKIRGYFQSEKYFIKHKKRILDLFAPHPSIVRYLRDKYGAIIDHPNTVSVHARSYLSYDPIQQYHPTLEVEYFEEAIKLFAEDSLFVVFSNDIEKCKKDFAHIDRNFRFIEGESHVHDLYLMSMCKDNIISNSSFSWWGAYLNRNPNKVVVAPPIWFGPSLAKNNTKDLLPKTWMVLHY